jgi:hypothetical protein
VIRGADGRIDGVRYEELAPLLLNEMQHERTEMTQKIDSLGAQFEKQGATVQALLKQNAEQAAEIRDLKQLLVQMQAGLLELQAKDGLVARR